MDLRANTQLIEVYLGSTANVIPFSEREDYLAGRIRENADLDVHIMQITRDGVLAWVNGEWIEYEADNRLIYWLHGQNLTEPEKTVRIWEKE
jgi:hypothetical protein